MSLSGLWRPGPTHGCKGWCRRQGAAYWEVYDATANKNGAVSGITEEGIAIGVKPGEFEFVEAPEWLKKIHANVG